MNITIKKIAELAGVSRGTVDRVLNNRPNVKPEIREKVLSIAAEYNYTPNKLARALAYNNKPTIIGVITPPWIESLFSDIHSGIKAAEDEFKNFGLKIEYKCVSNEDPEECINALNEFAQNGINGIALCAMNNKRIRDKVNHLVDMGIPIVTFNSDITDSKRLCFVGQDLYKSGRVAADLMGKCVGPKSKVVVALASMEFQAHKARIDGFLDKLKELDKGVVAADILQTFEKYQTTYDMILSSLKKDPEIQGIYMATEDVQGCVDAVKSFSPNHKIHVICNDMIPRTRKFLREGSVDFTICQDLFAQGYKPISILYNYIFDNKRPKSEIAGTDIKIITSENL
jgi:LacI family transcriptional regulator